MHSVNAIVHAMYSPRSLVVISAPHVDVCREERSIVARSWAGDVVVFG